MPVQSPLLAAFDLPERGFLPATDPWTSFLKSQSSTRSGRSYRNSLTVGSSVSLFRIGQILWALWRTIGA